MASITKRVNKEGKPTYYVVFRDMDGKQQWQKAGHRRMDADRLQTKIENALYSNTYKEASDITFKDFIDKWLKSKQPDVRQTTFYSYQQHCKSRFIPFFGNKKLSNIKRDDVEALKAHLFEAGITAPTIAKYLTTLKIAFNAACAWGYLQSNPAKFVKKPTFKKYEPIFLTPEQLKKMVDTAPDRHKAIMATACFTGMRRSELLGLKWDDVDFNNQKIYVRRSLQWGSRFYGNNFQFLDTKTLASKRNIDIPNFLVTLLKEHQLRQLVEIPENKHNLVFPNDDGQPLYAAGLIRYIFEPVLKMSGLPPVRFHDLRHSYASMLIGQNANIKYVQKQLGHSNVQMTLNVYSHLLPDAGRDTIEKLNDILSDKSSNQEHHAII